MDDKSKTKAQLLQETTALRRKVNELSHADTQRKGAETELIESEHKYRTLIESTQDLIFTVDRKGLFTYVNPQFETVTGYITPELMGSPFTGIIDPESRGNVLNQFKSGMRGEKSLPYEVNVLRKNGKKIPVEFLVTTLYNKNNDSIGRYGIGRDITNRIEAEKSLRESEQILYHVIQGSPTPAFVIGTDHKILYWNKALEELSKIKAADVIGTTQHWRAFYNSERPCLADLVLDGDIEKISQRYHGKCSKSNLIENAYEATDFFPHLGAEGRWLRFTGTAVSGLEGTVVCALETLEDVSDRRRAEEALQAAEALYRTLAERSFAGVYMVQDGKFRFINNNAASYAGYAREELLGQDAELLISMADREAAKKNAGAMLNGELTIPYEFRITTKQGETHWIMETVTTILYQGKPAILGNSMDITGRKMAEAALKETEERYRTLFDNANDAVFIVKDYKFIDCNNATLRIFDCSREQIIGNYPDAFSPPLQPDGLVSKEKAMMKINAALAGESQFFEWRHCRYDGTPFDAEVSLNSIKVGDGILVQAFVRDITDRKQVEEALRRSEERYRTIIEGIEDGYFEVDIKGSMTFCNPSTAKMLGYSQEELIGMNNRQYMDRKNARKVFSAFNAVYRTGVPAKSFDWELIRKDGENIIAETSVSLIRDAQETPVGFRGILRDITERRRMEEEIREMSLRDQLTDLYNRRGFITLAEQQIKAANRAKRQMMLSFIDVDGMKGINDTLGHEEGDKALIDAANILRKTLRESDIIARMGGDEFAVLAIDMTDLDPDVLSKRLQRNMDDWNAKESRPYKLAISWGTVIYDPESPLSLDQLMSSSDALMYTQKKAKTCRKI
jgi:diguanylate cyclase (GGDEF)-like protein/PAS domain S-box-containing protein